MPELNPQLAQFEKEIEVMLAELISKLEKGNFTRTQLAQISAEINFFDELKRAGFEKSVNKYFSGYETILADALSKARTLKVDFAGINTAALELIANLDEEFLLRKAASWGAQFKSEFAKSIIRGDTITQTAANLTEIPLTDAQMKTVLNTSYTEFNRVSTFEVFKSDPKQRFSYFGRIISTSSKQCEWLMGNQDPAGYTQEEINAGIDTPFGIINQSGRDPNFNCGHTWRPIITEL